MISNISVFCGSSEGYNETYRETAYELGKALADKGLHIIYGGAKVGLMGALADGAIEHNGKITGVIPGFLQRKEVVYHGLTRLIVVTTMHERKLKMYELSDAVITLPGGWGTMEELFEMLTWAQLGMHNYPIGLLNINGYYDSLIALCNSMVTEGFLDESTRNKLLISDNVEDLLQQMEAYEAPAVPQIITEQTS